MKRVNVGLTYTFRRAVTDLQQGLHGTAFAHTACAFVLMSELFAIFPPWFFILLGVGVLDALFQFSDYREWRKEQGESGDVNE